MDLSNLREEYKKSKLTYDNLLDNPIEQFEIWFKDAQNHGIPEPNAMSLATVSKTNTPNIRTVLLKYFDLNGFVFFTNFSSQKAIEIKNNKEVALLFPWISMERQIKIIGTTKKISTSDSLKYFMSRPVKSQLGAWVSQQSSQISSRKILLDKFWELSEKFKNGKIPFPDFWGGYCVYPKQIEFWQGGEHRLHDRFLYTRIGETENWETSVIAP